jgi:hypothetical protein
VTVARFTKTEGRLKVASELAVLSGKLPPEKVNLVTGRHLGLVAPLVSQGLISEAEVEAAVLYHMSESERNRWMSHSGTFTGLNVTFRNLAESIQAAVARFGNGYSYGLQKAHNNEEEKTDMATKVKSTKEQESIALREAGTKAGTGGTEATAGDGAAKGGKKAKEPKEPRAPRVLKKAPVVDLIACPFCNAEKGANCFGKLQEGQKPEDRKRVAMPHAARTKAAIDAGLLPKPEGSKAAAKETETASTPAPVEGATGGGEAANQSV